MSPGPDAQPSRECYRDAVTTLYRQGETNGTDGVPAKKVAQLLDVPATRAHYHLDCLFAEGEIDAIVTFPDERGGPHRRGYRPKNPENLSDLSTYPADS